MQGGGWLTEWLSNLSILAIFFVSLAAMMLAAAFGQFVRRLKASRSEDDPDQSIAQEAVLLSGALGLLGLLLAFSFGMVLNRYESRRQLVTQEANAIGTAYLRAQLLDEPHRSRLSGLLIAYTDNRIKLAGTDLDHNPYLPTNDRLLTEIWAAVRAARESALSHGITTALLVTFNEVIDLDTERKVAWQLRVPGEVLFLLLVYLMLTAAILGHSADGPRAKRAALVLFILLALSISVMSDVNRPMTGRSRESQLAMIMLLQSLKSQPAEVFDKFDVSREGGDAAGREGSGR
jgi:hypothetical protein